MAVSRVAGAPVAPAWVAAAWRLLHDDVPAGLAILDRDLRFVKVNATLAAMNGVPAEDHAGRPLQEVIPELADVVRKALVRVLTSGEPMLDLELSEPVPGAPHEERHWLKNIYPVPGPDGVPAGVAILVRDVTDLRRANQEAAARRAAAHRLQLLHRLAGALVDAVDTGHVARAVVDLAGETFGSDAAAVARFHGASGQVLAIAGPPEAERAAWLVPFDIDAIPPVADLIRSNRRVVWWGSRAERDDRFPPPGIRIAADGGIEAAAVAALLVDGRPVGCVGIGWRRPRRITPADVDLLATVAAQVTAAMERARSFDAERRAQRRQRLLAEVSAQLASADDEHQQLTRLVWLLTGGLADCGSVCLPDASGTLRRRILAATDPTLHASIQALVGTATDDDDPRTIAWRTGRPTMIEVANPDRYLRESGMDPRLVDPDRTVDGVAHAVATPLVARGRPLGVFVAWRSAANSPFDDADLQLLVDVGRRAGQAIDNLRLLATQTRIADRLQSNLLPASLPTIPGIELAARYLAGEYGVNVGGDFYDVFPVGDAYALVIGDVAGRGVDAAGLTGIARTTLRVLADHLPPAAILARLNAVLLERTDHGRFLTLAFLLLRPHERGATVQTWLAGHPPPLVVRPDGAVTDLGVAGHLLGILPEVTHHRHTYELTPGDLLLLHTDGLTEARGRDGLYGASRLPVQLASLAGVTAGTAVDRLAGAVTEYRNAGTADDTALVAVRLPPSPEQT